MNSRILQSGTKKSLLSNDRKCYICGSPYNLHKHHIFYGTANRRQSERYGCWVYLCYFHHNGSDAGVHFSKPVDERLKQKCQEAFEAQVGSRSDFISIFGRNYL